MKRDIFWYGRPPGQDWTPAKFGPLVCGHCVVAVPELSEEARAGKLVRLTALDAAEVASAHEFSPELLDCDGGCRRNLIPTCAQLPSYWRPHHSYGRN